MNLRSERVLGDVSAHLREMTQESRAQRGALLAILDNSVLVPRRNDLIRWGTAPPFISRPVRDHHSVLPRVGPDQDRPLARDVGLLAVLDDVHAQRLLALGRA